MSIEVIKKAFSLLECLADNENPIPLAEIARRTNLPKPTICRILQTIVKLGYVAQEVDSGYYYRTGQLERLGQNSKFNDLKSKALPLMKKLHLKFNETINLGILEGVNIHYIHFIQTTQSLRHMVKPNAIDPFYSTAIGRAIAAFLPKQESDNLIKKVKLEPKTPSTIKSKLKLEKILTDTFNQKFAVEDQETSVGICCFGIPLLENGYPVAGISITLPKIRLNNQLKKSIIEELKRSINQ